MDVGQDTALRDDDAAEQTVELLVLQSQRERRATTTHVADGELEVTRDDARLLVVAGGVAGELEDLGREVLEDGGEVDGRAGTDTLSVVAWRVSGARASARRTLAEETVDTTDRERETGLGRARRLLGVAAGLAARLAARLAAFLSKVSAYDETRDGPRSFCRCVERVVSVRVCVCECVRIARQARSIRVERDTSKVPKRSRDSLRSAVNSAC